MIREDLASGESNVRGAAALSYATTKRHAAAELTHMEVHMQNYARDLDIRFMHGDKMYRYAATSNPHG